VRQFHWYCCRGLYADGSAVPAPFLWNAPQSPGFQLEPT